MKFFTFRKVALAHKAAWQKLGFRARKGYFLFGKRPDSPHGEPKNDKPFTRPVPTPAPAPKPTTMYDDVNLSLIPKNATAVAGYVGGRWPTFAKLRALFPRAQRRVSIAVNASEDADILDIENGDATNTQAAVWFIRQRKRGLARPGFYTSVSNVPQLVAVLARAGIRRSDYKLWTAHYTGVPHLCGSRCYPGVGTVADATQYTDRALGRSLDASQVAPTFWS